MMMASWRCLSSVVRAVSPSRVLASSSSRKATSRNVSPGRRTGLLDALEQLAGTGNHLLGSGRVALVGVKWPAR